jgi:hypothetical protein
MFSNYCMLFMLGVFMNAFLSVLTLIFVCAKIVGAIDWSWWLIFTPVAVLFTINFIVFIIAIVVVTTKGWIYK